MAISSVGSYTNSYENLYTYNQTKKSETSEISEVKTETTKKSNNEEYLKSLQKQVPYMKLQIGYGLNTSNDGNNYKKSVGSTVIVRHDYIDENGNLSHFSVSIRKDEMNERLRKEAQENAEKQIEKTRENARKKAEQIAEKLEEKAEEAKEDGEKIAISEGIQDENEIVKDRAEKLLSEKLENATDGEVYLDNEDMQVIIDAAQNREAVTTNTSSEVGKNFDFKI